MISVGDQRYMLSFLFPQLTTRADSIYSKLASEESDDVSVSSAVESDDKSRESDDESDSYVSDESDPSSLVQAVNAPTDKTNMLNNRSNLRYALFLMIISIPPPFSWRHYTPFKDGASVCVSSSVLSEYSL